jgi:hypothetical protein
MTHALHHISPRRLLAGATVLATLALAIAFLTRPAPAKAGATPGAWHRGCSVRTLQGSYGGNVTGTTTSAGPTAGQVLEIFSGNGTGTADVTLMTQTQGPLSFTDEPVTYTLNSDCTGTLTAIRGGQTHHFDIVVTNSGRTIHELRIDPGNVLAATLEHV